MPPNSTPKSLGRRIAQILIIASLVFIGAMWFYAFVFAPKESINKIKDEQWAQRSQVRCEQAIGERYALMDLNRVDKKDPTSLAIRADLVDKATDALERMVDDLAVDTPNDPKGQALVPMWIADYRTYLQDRRDYVREMRQGRLPIFAETQVDRVPVSERIGKFARENRMRACQPPVDLVT